MLNCSLVASVPSKALHPYRSATASSNLLATSTVPEHMVKKVLANGLPLLWRAPYASGSETPSVLKTAILID